MKERLSSNTLNHELTFCYFQRYKKAEESAKNKYLRSTANTAKWQSKCLITEVKFFSFAQEKSFFVFNSLFLDELFIS